MRRLLAVILTLSTGCSILFHDGVGSGWQASDTPQCSTGVGFIALDTIFSVIAFSAALGVGLREDPDSVDVAIAIANGAEGLLFAISSQVGTSRRRECKRAIKEHDAWQVRMWRNAEAREDRTAAARERKKQQPQHTAELTRRGLKYQLAEGVVLFVRREGEQLQISFAEGAPGRDVTLFADNLEITPEKVTHANDGDVEHVVFRIHEAGLKAIEAARVLTIRIGRFQAEVTGSTLAAINSVIRRRD